MSHFPTPSYTTVERDALPSPQIEQVIWNSDKTEYQVYDGNQWHCIAHRSPNNAVYMTIDDGTGRIKWFSAGAQQGFLSNGQLSILPPAQFGASVILAASLGALNAVAALQVDSTTKGFMLPRMTTLQRDAILTPPDSLQIYNTDDKEINWYDGAAWQSVSSAASSTPALLRNSVSKSADYTIVAAVDGTVEMSTVNTVFMPLTADVGQVFCIKATNLLPVTIDGNGATIDDGSVVLINTTTLTAKGQSKFIQRNSTGNWSVI